MSKRKNDCTLNEFVVGYLKKAKYEKTLKLIAEKDAGKETMKTYKNFINYLKERETKTKIENDDDCLNCFAFLSVFQDFALGAWSLLCHSMHRHFPVCPTHQNLFISEADQGLSSKTLL